MKSNKLALHRNKTELIFKPLELDHAAHHPSFSSLLISSKFVELNPCALPPV